MVSDQSYDGCTSSRSGAAVVVRVERRRRWSNEQKLAIVRETTEPGAIVSLVASRHGLNTGQLYTWRRQLLAGAMAGFVPIELAASSEPREPAGLGRIEISSPAGLTISVDRVVDRAALRLVLDVVSELGR